MQLRGYHRAYRRRSRLRDALWVIGALAAFAAFLVLMGWLGGRMP